MTREEKAFCKRFIEIMMKLPDEKQQYILGYADGMLSNSDKNVNAEDSEDCND